MTDHPCTSPMFRGTFSGRVIGCGVCDGCKSIDRPTDAVPEIERRTVEANLLWDHDRPTDDAHERGTCAPCREGRHSACEGEPTFAGICGCKPCWEWSREHPFGSPPDRPTDDLPDFPTEDNWDSYGAAATTPEAIASARSIAMVPTTTGGVLIEHDGFAVTILPDGTIDPEVLVGEDDVSAARIRELEAAGDALYDADPKPDPGDRMMQKARKQWRAVRGRVG
jgi:hypothetical protein